MRPRRLRAAAAVIPLALACAACSGSSAQAPTFTAVAASPTAAASASAVGSSGSLAPRPASPAVVTIVSPTNGQVIAGSTVHVVVKVANAQVVQATTTTVVPDQGHVHLYLDNTLIYMQYSLEQDLPVQPGTYILKAEFVASDHAPFSPRVWSPQVIFTVK